MTQSIFSDHLQAAAQARMDNKTKPPGSLGQLERLAVQLAGVQGTLDPQPDPARILVFAADHGVAAAGVSAFPAEVTAQMMANFASGGAAVNVLSVVAGASLELIDVGVAADLSGLKQIRHAKVRAGSGNLLEEAAMSAAECEQAMQVGRQAVQRAVVDGMRCIGLGEMGIGNTTSAAILTGLMCNSDAATVTGRGTGVDDERLQRKQSVVATVLERLKDQRDSPMECLRQAGGLEVAALAGAMLEARKLGVPVIVDGYIVTAAALIACRVQPEVRKVLFFAHESAEPGHAAALAQLDAEPVLRLEMRLGEASAAALVLPLLRAAAAILRDMASFDDAGVSNRDVDDE